MASRLLFLLSVLFLVSLAAARRSSSNCRCLPSQKCWPRAAAWKAFNVSVESALIATKPAASPCYAPFYDQAACNVVKQKWTDPFWRSDQPGALQGPNNEVDATTGRGCALSADANAPCVQGALPLYTVRVTKAAHVQAAVSFASQHNLRLVIKNTGHELTGKNTAAGSLSIWMHNLKDITFSDNFKPAGCGAPWLSRWWWSRKYSVVKVGAGVQWEELYKAAFNNKRTVVGAQCSSVGAAGGYPQGGGHSQLAPSFGLAADNVVEYEVVLADGSLVVANSCQNSQLFWALRGGGGGTFGVVISTTYITYPALKNLIYASYAISAPTASAFHSIVTRFVQLNPYLSDSGWGGVFFIGSNNTLILQYLLPNGNTRYASSNFGPLLSYAKTQKGTVAGNIMQYPSYYEWHLQTQCPNGVCGFPSGYNAIETSRLVPRFTAQFAPSQLTTALVKFHDLGYSRVSGYLVAGGKVSIPQNNAVNPAWRRAIFHVLVVGALTEVTPQSTFSSAKMITNANKMLRDMTPGSGSYLNEADANEPNWQQSFFGSNYASLRAVKASVDPQGLFVCRHCVGSENWSEDLNCRL